MPLSSPDFSLQGQHPDKTRQHGNTDQIKRIDDRQDIALKGLLGKQLRTDNPGRHQHQTAAGLPEHFPVRIIQLPITPGTEQAKAKSPH